MFVQARRGWVSFLDRVSLAGVELILSEALFGGGGRLYNACELPVDLLGAVSAVEGWVSPSSGRGFAACSGLWRFCAAADEC